MAELEKASAFAFESWFSKKVSKVLVINAKAARRTTKAPIASSCLGDEAWITRADGGRWFR